MVEHRRHSMQKQWQLEPSDDCRRYIPRRAFQVEIYAEIPALMRPPAQSNSYDLTCLFAFSDFLREELRPRVLKVYLHERSGWYGGVSGWGDNLSKDWFRHLVLPASVKEMVVQMDFADVFSFPISPLYGDQDQDHQRLDRLFASLMIRIEATEKKTPEYLTLDTRTMEPLLSMYDDVLRTRSLSNMLSFEFTYRRHGRLYMAEE